MYIANNYMLVTRMHSTTTTIILMSFRDTATDTSRLIAYGCLSHTTLERRCVTKCERRALKVAILIGITALVVHKPRSRGEEDLSMYCLPHYIELQS